MDAKPGDVVKVETNDDVFEGILLPRPEILEKGILVLKLANGYNVGIEEKKIIKISVVEKEKKKTAIPHKVPFDAKLSTVAVLSVGGTISSKIDYTTGGTSAEYTADDFVMMCPELASIANIRAKKILSVMSEDLTPVEWKLMANEIAVALQDADGVVITHGTDTLHFSAAILSFMLENVGKPVVITGAQRSIDRGSTDSFMNLICSVAAAARFNGSGVFTCLHGSSNDDFCLLIRGTKVRKMHTSRRDAFRPVNAFPVAKVFASGEIEVMDKGVRVRNKDRVNANTKLDDRVEMVLVYPHMDPGIIEYHVKNGVKGLIIAATALGHVPSSGARSLLPELEKALKVGVVVVIASQTVYGHVHPYVYTNLRKLSVQLGCIFVEDMLPEVAYVKLMHVLGNYEKGQIKQKMVESLAGEITTREGNTFLI